MAVAVVLVVTLLLVSCDTVPRSRRKRIVGGQEAAIPPQDDPVVFVYRDGHNARVYGKRERDYYAFLGIRYAEPPVGNRRFQRPRRLRLDGDVNATIPGPPCVQPAPGGRGITGSEDCLFLNVFTPELPGDGSGLPVLVWIHGGGFRRGSAGQYGVSLLVSKRVVVVTMQYRLGTLGFLSAAAKELPGNAGMFDMVAVLDWVRDYIPSFGGNPLLVKTMGQGSGASAALMLGLSRLTKGLLGGVIALSGNALSTFAIDHDPLATARDLAAYNSCPVNPVLAMVRCLQELPVDRLVAADTAVESLRLKAQGFIAGLTALLGVAPVVEGPDDGRSLPHFLTRSPLDLIKEGGFPPIPLLTGVTRDETSTAIYGTYREEILHGIAKVPGYVDNVLGGMIKNTAYLVGNVTDGLLQVLATNYFSFLTIEDTDTAFDRLTEMTGDALFNLPAFQTAQWWSKWAPTFLYSFEHAGDRKGGPAFLQGLPLVQAGDKPLPQGTGIGHGDDLPYAFDAHPLNGSSGDNIFPLSDLQDFKVQGHVTDFIAEFARSGVPCTGGAGGGGLVQWPPFTPSRGVFIRVSAAPEAAHGFRSCEMGLWTGSMPTLGLHAQVCRTVETLVPLASSIGRLSPLSGPSVKEAPADVMGLGKVNPLPKLPGFG